MRMPDDVLIVEDDPIIALDFEDTILGFGVKTRAHRRQRGDRARLIAERAPDFALLDVGLVREKSFAVAERLDALKIPFAFVTGYGADVEASAGIRRPAEVAKALLERRAADPCCSACRRPRRRLRNCRELRAIVQTR